MMTPEEDAIRLRIEKACLPIRLPDSRSADITVGFRMFENIRPCLRDEMVVRITPLAIYGDYIVRSG